MPFYLLGSVHASQRTDYQRVPAIEEAIKQSQQVLFELDLASKLSIPQPRFEAHSDFVRIDRQNAAAKTRSATNRRSAPAAITS